MNFVDANGNFIKWVKVASELKHNKNAKLKWRVKQWIVKDNHAEMNKIMTFSEFVCHLKKRPNARLELVSTKPYAVCDHSWDMSGYFIYYQFGFQLEDGIYWYGERDSMTSE